MPKMGRGMDLKFSLKNIKPNTRFGFISIGDTPVQLSLSATNYGLAVNQVIPLWKITIQMYNKNGQYPRKVQNNL